MKHSILCGFLAVVFTVSVFQPFTSLDAAEIWNSQRKGKVERTRNYYNSTNSSRKAPSATLYNSSKRRSQSKVKYGAGLSTVIQSYKDIKKSKQKTPKYWELMSESARANLQADFDRALQIEKKTRKNTLKTLVKLHKEDEKARQMNKKLHEEW